MAKSKTMDRLNILKKRLMRHEKESLYDLSLEGAFNKVRTDCEIAIFQYFGGSDYVPLLYWKLTKEAVSRIKDGLLLCNLRNKEPEQTFAVAVFINGSIFGASYLDSVDCIRFVGNLPEYMIIHQKPPL